MKRIAYLLFALITLWGCDKKKTELVIESYPMTLGSTWDYERTYHANVYETEFSNEVIDEHNIIDNLRVSIEKDTVLNDTMQVTEFRTVDKDNGSLAIDYKYMDEEGLKTYAYVVAGGLNVSVKKSASFQSSFIFNPLISLHKYGVLHDIVVEKNERFNLALPLQDGMSWNYYKSEESGQSEFIIDKHVIGEDNISAAGQSFACFKVLWDFNDSSNANTVYTDWLSEQGLIKRVITYGRIQFTDNEGEPIGWFESTDTYVLTSYDIK